MTNFPSTNITSRRMRMSGVLGSQSEPELRIPIDFVEISVLKMTGAK